MHEVDGDGMGRVLDLFRETVGQPRESPHVHAHREILPFDIAGRDLPYVGIANDALALAADALRWTVAFLGLWVGAVDLYELGKVDLATEGIFHGIQIHFVAIGG